MKIELYQIDLVNLVTSVEPYYNLHRELIDRELGSWTGGFVDKWDWNKSKLSLLTETELVKLYYSCKASWK